VDRRNSEIEAVTMEQVKAAGKRLFEGQALITTVVGKPKAWPWARGGELWRRADRR
jgi:predicted Zn-dependent peptidase